MNINMTKNYFNNNNVDKYLNAPILNSYNLIKDIKNIEIILYNLIQEQLNEINIIDENSGAKYKYNIMHLIYLTMLYQKIINPSINIKIFLNTLFLTLNSKNSPEANEALDLNKIDIIFKTSIPLLLTHRVISNITIILFEVASFFKININQIMLDFNINELIIYKYKRKNISQFYQFLETKNNKFISVFKNEIIIEIINNIDKQFLTRNLFDNDSDNEWSYEQEVFDLINKKINEIDFKMESMDNTNNTGKVDNVNITEKIVLFFNNEPKWKIFFDNIKNENDKNVLIDLLIDFYKYINTSDK